MNLKNRILYLLFMGLILSPLNIMAQSKSISGKITDPEGNELIGVNIVVKGTLIGTISSYTGEFSMNIPADVLDPVLVISYIGSESREIPVGNTSIFDIVLQEDREILDEVVVVGYSTQKKANLTGAISTINVKEINKSPVTNLEQAMQGKLPGVSVTQNTGQPGEGINIKIRGLGTLGNNNPLYIVDGLSTKDISGISQSDIESIQVLKDASAAIYGSRASNGVILITTKNGKAGATRVDIGSYYGIQKITSTPDMLNTQQFIEIQNEAYENDGSSIRNPYTNNYGGLPDLKYFDELFVLAPMQEHKITVSGGNDQSTILLSGGYTDQRGVIPNSGYKRVNVRLNSSTKIYPNLKIGENLSISNSTSEAVGSSGDGAGGNGGGIIRYAYLRPSALPVRNSNGDYADIPEYPNFYGDAYNPIGLAEYRSDVRNNFRVFGNTYLDWDILETLKFKTDLGIDINFNDNRRFDRNWGDDFDGDGKGRINDPNGLSVLNAETYNILWNGILAYNNSFGEHDISGFVGVETIINKYKYMSASRSNFENQELDNLIDLNLGSINSANNGGSREAWALLSQFANANYSFKSKYLASLIIRRDGSSKFGKDNRYGIFPSISVGWKLIDEDFMSFMPETVDNVKIRASWGQLGNQDIPAYAAFTSVGAVGNGYSFGDQYYQGVSTTETGNDKIKWEVTTTSNIGLDVSVLRGKFYFSADYFRKNTSDILIRVPTPAIGGANANPYVNAAEVANSGVELNLMYRKAEGKLKFELSGNIATLKNEVTSIGSGEPIQGGYIGTYVTLTEVGQPIGSFFLYEAEGIFQKQEEINELNAKAPSGLYQRSGTAPGDIKYKDNNHDGEITEADRAHVGSAIPNLTYGLTTNISYGNFDLSIFFQGVSGNKVYSEIDRIIVDATRPFNSTTEILDRWTTVNPHNNIRAPRVTIADPNGNKTASTRYLQNGAYTRLKNITLGYTLSEEKLAKVKIQQCRLFMSAQNLLTITKYKGFDPEMGTNDNDAASGDLSSGIDWGTYPSPTILTFGFNIGF